MPKPNSGISVNSGPRAPGPAVVISGDLAGNLSRQTVTGLQGFPVSRNGPNTDNVLKYDGAQWGPATSSTGVVDNLQGFPLSPNAPGTNQILQYDGAAWAPADEVGGSDIGALHPASGQRLVGGLIAPQPPGGPDCSPGAVLTATCRAVVRGSVCDQSTTGCWALAEGVAYQIGFPGDNVIGVIPLFDDNSTAIVLGPEPMTFGAGKIWALQWVPSVFPPRGSLTRINPNLGENDYFNHNAGQGVVDGRVSFSEFDSISGTVQVFWVPIAEMLVVYSTDAFLVEPGGVFYQVFTGNLQVQSFTLDNTSVLWPDGGFRFAAFKYCPDDGFVYALATFDGTNDSMSGTRLVKISFSFGTGTVVDQISYPGVFVSLNSAKLEYSNLQAGKLHWVTDNGIWYRASRSPFLDDGLALDVGVQFTNVGGGFSQLWGIQSGGSYDQTIGIAVGNDSSGDTLILDVNLFDLTMAGTSVTVGADTGITNGQPEIGRVQYVPYPESGWWLYDDANAKIYRYYGFGNPSPQARLPFGGGAAWVQPSGGGGGGPLVFDGDNIRADWSGFSPVDNTKTGIVNISLAGGEPAGALEDYSTIIGGHDHSVHSLAGTVVGGTNNEVGSGSDYGICIGGTGNFVSFGPRSVVGGSLSTIGGADSIAVGRQAHANGRSSQAFGGNDFTGPLATADNSFAHGAGGFATMANEYNHGAVDESDGTQWFYGRVLLRGRSVNGATTFLTTSNTQFAEEFQIGGNKRTAYLFVIHINATRIFGDAAPGTATWIRKVVAHIGEDAATLIIDSIVSDLTQTNGQGWTIAITGDQFLLHISLTGTAGQTVRVSAWIDYSICLAFPNF